MRGRRAPGSLDLGHGLGRTLAVDVDDQHPYAPLGEVARGRATDRAAAAGDNRRRIAMAVT